MTKVIAISDTHGYHDHVRVPPGDLLLFAGDYTKEDIGRKEARAFLVWLERQPCPVKVLVLGNHDGAGQRWPDLFAKMVEEYAPSVIWLQDAGTTLCGFNIWGSAWTPTFFNWYYMKDRGAPIRACWDLIPTNTDILVTHGPPFGYGDWSPVDRVHAGDADLLDAIKRVKPKLCVHGHFHGGYAITQIIHDDESATILCNASVCNEAYKPVNAPWVFGL